MDANTRLAAPGRPPLSWRAFIAVFGSMFGAIVLGLVLWWLPARGAAGYRIPEIRGVVAQTPRLTLFWVRPWPWSTVPPRVRITFHLSSGYRVSEEAAPLGPVSWFSARAQPVPLSSTPVAFPKSGLISRITVHWAGGQTDAHLPDLWAVHAFVSPQIRGWVPLREHGGRIAIVLSYRAAPVVIAASTPDPSIEPWRVPRCAALAGPIGASPQTSAAVGSLSRSRCAALSGSRALVETGAPPSGAGYYVWQPVLEELSNQGHAVTAAGSFSLMGSSLQPNAFNWWRFLPQGSGG